MIRKIVQDPTTWDFYVSRIIYDQISIEEKEKENIQKWLLQDGTRVITLRRGDVFLMIEPRPFGELEFIAINEFRSYIIENGGCEVNRFPLGQQDFISEWEDG